MKFNLIELKSQPEFRFAVNVEVKNYYNSFNNVKNFLEITYYKKGRTIREYKDKTEIFEPECVNCIFSDDDFKTYAYNGELQFYSTVGVDVNYVLTHFDTSNCDVEFIKMKVKKGAILLPISLNPKEQTQDVINHIKRIIKQIHLPYVESTLQALSNWYSLCSLLTKLVLREIDNSYSLFPPSEQEYAKRALSYIDESLSERLTVKKIANFLNLSEGYLHRIFNHVYKTGVIEFINDYKVKMAIELIKNKNLSLKDASIAVGINDPSYMSRLFKKVTGLSYREYFKREEIQLKN